MPRILITRRLPDTVLEAARARFEVVLNDNPAPLTEEGAAAALADYDAILPTLGDAFTAGAFARAGAVRCRLLANFGVGYNHIDVAAAKAAGVAVTNTPGAVTDATADIAMTLLLTAARRAGEGERLVRAGAWTGWQPTQMLGRQVTGKRLGIVGMGRIGRAVARRAHHGFGMQVAFFNRSPVADAGVPARQVATLAEAMAQDFVVIAVPGGAGTRHLIGAAALAAMPAHGVLVNVARGDVVDEPALIAALEEGRIAAAGLDVYEYEPEVPAALRRLENAVLLPHLGTAVLEVREAMGMMAVKNLIAWAEGRPLPNPV
ncbi:2-hydroxyacid dehydrogenase [Ruixingdingia sedimenti]|uniref:D-glycerate dehydrogenase n=1 Tax=Ruixingdingia sedimenti TaxID=3073604 RepID=A0ABU1F2S8_9RHOB|nr:D-glycerate dehydrogenase [Xinfangfangia sp. LG-4]MDR5651169.1 D-glycerate dehydrogenase [Xinfangfangia sp. LG-4]